VSRTSAGALALPLADYDNDGWPDIYVANYGKNRLYHNNHERNFHRCSGKGGSRIGNMVYGAYLGDYDRDGSVDLFVPGT